jgi:hypothetical protein
LNREEYEISSSYTIYGGLSKKENRIKREGERGIEKVKRD